MPYYRNIDRQRKTLSDWPHVVATVLVCLLCWAMGYVYSSGFPLAPDDAILPIWKSFCNWLDNRTVVYTQGMFFIALTAFIIQRINDIEMLIRERTRLVFMLFFLLSSTNIGIIPFSNITIVLLCLVLVIYELFKTFQLPEAKGKLFNIGVYIGVAGLFMPQTLWFILLAWIGMYQLQSLNYRSFMASLFGVLTVFWLMLTWCVWKHDYSMFTMLFSSLTDFQLFSIFRSFRYTHIGFAFIVILTVPVFINIKMNVINNRLRVRQMLSFLLNMSAWTFVLICIYDGSVDAFLSILYIPLAVLMAYFFENLRKPFHFLLYYFLLVISVVSFIFRIWNY